MKPSPDGVDPVACNSGACHCWSGNNDQLLPEQPGFDIGATPTCALVLIGLPWLGMHVGILARSDVVARATPEFAHALQLP
eukprot:206326-Chlamydomonas_euryale.AAC.2